MSLARALVRLIRGQPAEPHDLEAAERYVRDWLGCTVAGRATAPGATLTAYGRGMVDLDGRVFLAAAVPLGVRLGGLCEERLEVVLDQWIERRQGRTAPAVDPLIP